MAGALSSTRTFACALAVAGLAFGSGCEPRPEGAGAATVAGAGAGAATPAASATPVPASAPLADAFGAALTTGVRRSADDPSTFEVDSFLATVIVEALLSGTSGLEITARQGEDGAIAGYRLGGIGPGSPFTRLGLAEGDVVAAINGVGLTSPGRALAVIETARRQVVVAIERGDEALFLDYRLVDGMAWASTLSAKGVAAPAEPAPAAMVVDASALVAAVEDDALAEVAGDAPAVVVPSAGATPPPAAGGGAGKPVTPSKGPSKAPSSAPSPKKQPAGSSSSGGSSPAASSSTSARCSSAESCTISRKEIDRVLADPSKAKGQASVVPHISGGKHVGYRLTNIKRGSAVDALGFKNGDVVTSINGHRLNDDADAFALYLSLPATSTFRVTYQRGGNTRVKTVKSV